MPQKSNTSDKTLNEDILKELKNINSQLLNLNNKIEESNLLARESKSNEDATRYTDQRIQDGTKFAYTNLLYSVTSVGNLINENVHQHLSN
ncbi:Hypothetical predicted protein [Octopus vulgaris]|uniref:Uncharacterized protein n=1 Tax=Octopus vulgaris TaxID=6645 RepID=A0AA36AZP2_OCTVU|nr:Hypothetical predicted protein [Octopus vulgaris]